MTLPSAFGLRRSAYWKGKMHHANDVIGSQHQLTAIAFILFVYCALDVTLRCYVS